MIGYSPLPAGQSGGITGTLRANAWSGGGFDPASITQKGVWFDWRTLAAVGDGNPVSTWVDRNGLYTAENSGTARPTFVADDGDGKGAVLYDAVNDNLQFAATNADLWGPDGYLEMWCVVKIPAAAAGNENFFNSAFLTGTAVSFTDNPSSTRWYFGIGGQTAYGSALDTHDDTWHVMRFVNSSSGQQWWVDGVNIGTVTFGSLSWNAGDCLGYLGGSAGAWQGKMRHFLSFKAPLDDDTAAALTSYLTDA